MTSASETLLGGRYEILNRLGQGGMADVFHARDLNLQREVAIKVLRDSRIENPAFQARFLQEARAAANLAHPNIVTIYDFGYDAGRYFIVMEYVSGTDLKTLIRRRGHLPVSEAVDLMVQICAGVGYAHRAGLIHCDLKPQNVLVGIDGVAKITDFGIARALATIHPDEFYETVWGSPLYFAPEQAAGFPPSPASDVYALGITLFEMLTGAPPFNAEDAQILAALHQTARPPSLRLSHPEISETLEQIIFKVLSKEPSARYRTADQFGRVLMTFASQAQVARIHPQSVPPPDPLNDPFAPTSHIELTSKDQVDWLAILLALLSFLAIGGLVPLWLWVCLLYPSCPLNGG
ncbi:MAG: protein kinase [Anaerolineales bacterium]|nr:protein kinase [Anaerolineales bacterium]